MTSNYDADDLARLFAIEHIVSSMALMWSVNFAQMNGGTPSDSVKLLRDALEGSLHDDANYSKEVRDLVRTHIARLFNHIASMAVHADKGV